MEAAPQIVLEAAPQLVVEAAPQLVVEAAPQVVLDAAPQRETVLNFSVFATWCNFLYHAFFSISVRNYSKMTEMCPKKVQNTPFSPQKGDLIKLENYKARTYIPQHGDLIQLEILRPGLY